MEANMSKKTLEATPNVLTQQHETIKELEEKVDHLALEN